MAMVRKGRIRLKNLSFRIVYSILSGSVFEDMIDEIRDNNMPMAMQQTDPKRIVLNKKETRILSLIA